VTNYSVYKYSGCNYYQDDKIENKIFRANDGYHIIGLIIKNNKIVNIKQIKLNNNTIHYNIFCDYCYNNNIYNEQYISGKKRYIKGDRYKCLVCKDYDLCHEHYNNNVHDHEFEKITESVYKNKKHFMHKKPKEKCKNNEFKGLIENIMDKVKNVNFNNLFKEENTKHNAYCD